MSSTTVRSSDSTSAPILNQFNALVPTDERRSVMEALMLTTLEDRERRYEQIAHIYMTDPAFAQCREDEKLWEVVALDGLHQE